MVGTVLSVGLSLGLFAVILCDDYFPVGPRSMMRRLSDKEFEELQRFCKYPPISSRRTVEDRIIGGQYASKSQFPIATVAIMSADGEYRCAATFITSRHLVTAAHCFHSLFHKLYNDLPKEGKPEEAPPPYLLVGGVCIRKTGDRCVETDTSRREIDFAIYDTQSGVDLAIVQLRKDQEQKKYDGMLPACIYDTYADDGTNVEPPKLFEIYGWGRIRLGNDPGKSAKRYNCRYRQPKGLGDSGGSVYTRRGDRMYLAAVYTAHGAVIPGPMTLNPPVHYVHVAVDLRAFKPDLCHILGLCIEGKSWRDSVPKLKWNSVYIVDKQIQFGLVMNQGVAYYNGEADARAPAPFPAIGTGDQEWMIRTCDKIRRGVRRRSEQLAVERPWIAQLIDPDTKFVLCQAVLLGDFHAITHKKCFEDAKQRNKKPLLYVGGNCRPSTPNCEATEALYNFAAWSSQSGRALAIINIVEYTGPSVPSRVRGACFPYPQDALPVKIKLYGYDAGNGRLYEKLKYGAFKYERCEERKPLQQFCLELDADDTSAPIYRIRAEDIGSGAIDQSKDSVCGLVAEREERVASRIFVTDIRPHLDDICFYTNRCDHRESTSGYTLMNITLFDQIYGTWSPPKENKQSRRKIHRRKKHRKTHRRLRA